MECLRGVQNSLVGESCLVGIVPPPLSLLSRRGDVEGMGGMAGGGGRGWSGYGPV